MRDGDLETRFNALLLAFNELERAVRILASDHGDVSALPNGGRGKQAWPHLESAARHLTKAQPPN
jgi:hypothetical protein